MQPQFWHWWILALALGIAEMFLPGAALLWLALSAGLIGLTVLMVPDLTWQTQAAAFALMAIALVIASRFLPRRAIAESDQPTLNQRARQYVGRTLVLETGIVNGRGRAVVGDSLWAVTGPDGLPAGTTVRVVDADGALLRVEPA